MTYLVLARKWRPMQFKDVVAQEHVTTTLENAIKQNRVASAYLFSGPRGVGKTTTARIFAKALNCDQGPTPTPCNTCTTCQEITESRSLDVFEIDGASNRGIDEVRNLRENLKYAPSKGKHKIYIIDEVHMLTTEAFNALLKTLEEPPPNVLFIFATTEPHKVPATILSRCQRYDFRRIPLQTIVAQLQSICKAEKIEIEDEALFLIARKADGSMRDSLSILDQVVSFSGEKVDTGELSQLLGLIDREVYFQFTRCLSERNAGDGLQLIDSLYRQGVDLGEFLNGLVEHLRDLLVLKATGDLTLIEGGDSYAAKFEESKDGFSDLDLLRLIRLASETAGQIKRSPNPKMLLEVLFLQMARMDRSVELDDLLRQLNQLGTPSGGPPVSGGPKPETEGTTKGTSSGATAVPVSTQAAAFSPKRAPEGGLRVREPGPASTLSGARAARESTEAPKPEAPPAQQSRSAEPSASDAAAPELTEVQRAWEQIVDAVKAKKIHIGSFLNEGYPTASHDGVLQISFGKENGFHMDRVSQHRRLIEEVIEQVIGVRFQIKCIKDDSKSFKQIIETSQPEPEESKPDLTQPQDLQIPILKKVIEIFDGEVVRASGHGA